MSVFTVDLKNQPGELARLCEAMAGRGINLVLSATARGEQGTVVFIADDEASAETVLQDADIQYTMRPALTIRMENQPERRRGHVPQARQRRAAAAASAGPDRGPVRHDAV